MPDPPEHAVHYAIITMLFVSVAMLGDLLRKYGEGTPPLKYRSRRPVPWSFVAVAVLMMSPLLSALASALAGTPPASVAVVAAELQDQLLISGQYAAAPSLSGLAGGSMVAVILDSAQRAASDEQFVTGAWLNFGVYLLATLLTWYALQAACQVTLADLGLPSNWSEFWEDTRIGVGTFLAAFAPVYGLHLALSLLLQPETGHPFVERVLVTQNPYMLPVVACSAVIAAPLFEETAFRLVLQGWLEKQDFTSGSANVAFRENVQHDQRYDSRYTTQRELLPIAENSSLDSPIQSNRFPVAWPPILISSTLFGLAHWGHGVAPVPLILLGVFLGYTYQRTHRLLPCIVAHALFNSFTTLTLWLTIST